MAKKSKKVGKRPARKATKKAVKTAAKKSSKKLTKKLVSKRTAKKAAKKSVKKTVRTHAGGKRTTKKTRKKAARRPGARDAKQVYSFGSLRTEGDASMGQLLGARGANLADMTVIGLPVPPGFTITTEACASYYSAGRRLPHGLMNEVHKHTAMLEKETGKKFGDNSNPLLVSVRAGAAASMPGMMDTILNLGMTDVSVEVVAKTTGDARFAHDAYRRLIRMFGNVVMGVEKKYFEAVSVALRDRYHAADDTEVPAEGLKELCELYKEVFRKQVGQEFPQNPFKQLELAIEAMFKSWNEDQAISYRRIEGISGLTGTAVNVQSMVYGNMGDDSCAGIAFTRNPSTGENKLYGEFLVNAQGDDIFSGIRTSRPIAEMSKWNKELYAKLLKIKTRLEKHYRDMQDIEFTIERGELFMLQANTGERTGGAAVKVACDMVKEKLIDEKTALLCVAAGDLIQLPLPGFDRTKRSAATVLATGLPASPGAAVGHPAFTAEEALERARKGESVVLVLNETSQADVDGMHAAAGILTSTGGATGYAARVARGWGKCCITGARTVQIDANHGEFRVGGRIIGRGDLISIDGSTGEVMSGAVRTVEPEPSGDFVRIMRWADKHRTMGVRANADTPDAAKHARESGADGVGLFRTECMFYDGDRIIPTRKMILADTLEEREHALSELLPLQREDFVDLFRVMNGLRVTIRLLDHPLREFVPNDDVSQQAMARKLGLPFEVVRSRVSQLHEFNPALGHRGCRLAVSYPEILCMQVRAIAEAAIEATEERVRALPEIMIPLVGTRSELVLLRGFAEETIKAAKADLNFKKRLEIKIGAMIEAPRAALTAGEIAEVADFFSFGTNDLTQFTFGYSHDDVDSFLPGYLQQGILPSDPFRSLDQAGVGQLVTIGLEKGRAGNGALKVGICGEHGGDPSSIHFCHDAGIDYVSCSRSRVPVARLAAAQAALMAEQKK